MMVLNGVENFRDLGGYPCSYGETQYGVIYRSATLAEATPQDKNKIADLGIKTILDLRDDESRNKAPSPFLHDPRFEVKELSVNGNGRISKDYEDYLNSYMEMVEDPYTARRIFKAILESPKPLVIHCNAGKDRTGVFSALLLLFAGVPLEMVNADYMMSFPLLPKMTQNTRQHHPEIPELLLTPMTGFFPEFYQRFLKRYGDLEQYCEAIGLSDDEYRSLVSLLGKQEKSCGAVVFHNGKVLVEHMIQGHYSIPKGHVESFDADEYATARREIKEETGLEVDHFLSGFRYPIFYSPRVGVFKEVVFYIAEVKTGDTVSQKEEVESCHFISPADAMRVLSHDSDRRVMKEAAWYEANHHDEWMAKNKKTKKGL